MTIGRGGVHEIVVARAGRLVFLSREQWPSSGLTSGKSRNHPSGRSAALEHGRHARSSEKSHWPGLERLAKDCPEF